MRRPSSASSPRAAILAIGDEIVLGQQLDTNSQWLGAELAKVGYLASEHRTVADDRGAIASALRDLAARCEAIVVTGGLGPTLDDLTRDALGDVVTPGVALVEDADALANLARWFGARGRTMSPSNRLQALRPTTARMLDNPNGTAPGLAAAVGACKVFCLPGPPREMQPMFRDFVLSALRAADDCGDGSAADDAPVILTASIAQIGLGESVAAERLGPLMERTRNPSVGTTASGGVVTARIRSEGPRRNAERALAEVVAEVHRHWAPYAFGAAASDLVPAIGALLVARGGSLAVAESCTGGLLGATIVDVAGSSAFFVGGYLTYSNALKELDLAVDSALLAAHGAVSAPVATAMARGALQRSNATCALAITGIAGPHGGTPAKPVGTVFIALAQRGATGSGTLPATSASARHFRISGDRRDVRERSALLALQWLRLELLRAQSLQANSSLPTLIWEVAEQSASQSAEHRAASAAERREPAR